ncbi:MAG TPA: hypothetical protein ENK91_01635 [Bacteroidetes bacterium]|nr:hypothetical protein [Bacteroidota bacterium]
MNLLFVPLFFLQIYAGDLDASIAVLQKNYNLVKKVNNKFNVDKDKVLSIVAPEISRWVSFNDYVETKALELLYISKGYEYCNFSIGYFQMKPKFIEDLEEYILKNNLDSSYSLKDLLIDRDIPPKKQRKIRLKRLKSFEWQLVYAYAFYVIAEHRFRIIRFENNR